MLGLQLHPLRSLDELAAVLETQLVFPEGTPRRARRMLEELRLRGVNLSTEFELTQLIERLEASDGWAAALGKLRVPSERRVVLVPPVTRCVVPGCQGGRLVHARDGRSSCPQVFSIDGELKAELCGRECVDCHAVHYHVVLERQHAAAPVEATLLRGRGLASLVPADPRHGLREAAARPAQCADAAQP